MTRPPAKPTSPTLAPPPSSSARQLPGGPAPLPGPAGPKLSAGRTSPVPSAAASAATGRELAQPYAALALARLAEIINDPDPKAALPACRDILDRAWGKAETAARAVGEEGLVVVVQLREPEDA